MKCKRTWANFEMEERPCGELSELGKYCYCDWCWDSILQDREVRKKLEGK